jgi:hypothetical protein
VKHENSDSLVVKRLRKGEFTMSKNQKPSETAYVLAVQIEVLSMLLKEKRQLIEAVFAEFPTEGQIYADESGAKNILIDKVQTIRGHLSDVIVDIDGLLNNLGGGKNISAPVASDVFTKISEFGG